jgi:hypothetical protein
MAFVVEDDLIGCLCISGSPATANVPELVRAGPEFAGPTAGAHAQRLTIYAMTVVLAGASSSAFILSFASRICFHSGMLINGFPLCAEGLLIQPLILGQSLFATIQDAGYTVSANLFYRVGS